jgi:hypothetical protein
MVTLARRAVAECVGTAFLLGAVVGSGIMAQRLADGNGALALLCNTLPTGAILTVLILTLGPLSGAHFNPAVSLSFALQRKMPSSEAAVYIAAQLSGAVIGAWGGASDVRFAHAADIDHGPFWLGSMVSGVHCDFRAHPDGSWMPRARTRGGCLCCRSLYHRSLLVHRFDLVRQSGSDGCTRFVGHLRRDRTERSAGIHHRANDRNAQRFDARALALSRLRRNRAQPEIEAS